LHGGQFLAAISSAATSKSANCGAPAGAGTQRRGGEGAAPQSSILAFVALHIETAGFLDALEGVPLKTDTE